MKGFKGYNKDLTCRGKQYKENTIFEEDEAQICKIGMHFCKNPFDVLDYYGFVGEDGDFNEFTEVESLDNEYTDDNKKYCTKKLRVGEKLGFSKFVKMCVDFIVEKTDHVDNNDLSQIGSSGDYAQIGSSCNYAQIGSSGDYERIGSSGNYARIGSSGNFAQIGSSGNYAQIGSSGDYERIGSSGNFAQIGSSGNFAQIGSSGNSAKIGSSGDSARIGSSGNSAQIGSSGNYAKIGSSGDNAQINSNGEYSVICCAGNNSKVRAKKGSWITLSEWKYDFEKNINIPVCVRTEFVDGEKIKEDTFYKLVDGEFCETN